MIQRKGTKREGKRKRREKERKWNYKEKYIHFTRFQRFNEGWNNNNNNSSTGNGKKKKNRKEKALVKYWAYTHRLKTQHNNGSLNTRPFTKALFSMTARFVLETAISILRFFALQQIYSITDGHEWTWGLWISFQPLLALPDIFRYVVICRQRANTTSI